MSEGERNPEWDELRERAQDAADRAVESERALEENSHLLTGQGGTEQLDPSMQQGRPSVATGQEDEAPPSDDAGDAARP